RLLAHLHPFPTRRSSDLGAGMAIFYPASQALLPRLVPDRVLQEASAMSRLAMNAAQMAGAAIAGVFVAATGPGWALATCGIGMQDRKSTRLNSSHLVISY